MCLQPLFIFPNVSCVAKLFTVLCISAAWVDSGAGHQHLVFFSRMGLQLWEVLPPILVCVAMYKMEMCCNVDRHYFRSSQVTTFKNELQLYLSSKYGEIVVCKCIFLNEILKILR